MVRQKNQVIQLIQVCYELNTDNKDREIIGLAEVLNIINLSNEYVEKSL